MQLNCPVCHAAFPLEAALQHEAGREVMVMLAGMQPELSRLLLHYLAYFRPARQQLGWGRALRLMREVLALDVVPVDVLVVGLAEAARTLDDKRAAPGWKPLGNHNYLRRCIESAAARGVVTTAPVQDGAAQMQPVTPVVARSKAGGALMALEGMKR